MLELGIKAPDFELPDQNGEVHKLSDYAGKKVTPSLSSQNGQFQLHLPADWPFLGDNRKGLFPRSSRCSCKQKGGYA